jgi:hypothetical protein
MSGIIRRICETLGEPVARIDKHSTKSKVTISFNPEEEYNCLIYTSFGITTLVGKGNNIKTFDATDVAIYGLCPDILRVAFHD